MLNANCIVCVVGAYHDGLIGQYIAMIRLASESDIVLGVTGG